MLGDPSVLSVTEPITSVCSTVLLLPEGWGGEADIPSSKAQGEAFGFRLWGNKEIVRAWSF